MTKTNPSPQFEDDAGLTLTEAAQATGFSRNALKKRCDRNTIEYFIDTKGSRRIPFDVIQRMGQSHLDDFAINPYEYDPKFDIPKAEIWGNGKAPVVDPITTEHWELVMGVNDIHYPWHDAMLLDAAIELAAEIQPHRFIINGDTNDFFAISRYNRALERLDMLQAELDGGKAIRKAFRNVLPDAQFEETIGNHEERLITYPGFNAPALKSLNALKPSVLLGLDELEIRHWPTNGFRLREEFLVEHGNAVAGQSGQAARKRLEQTLISGVMGHTHKLGSAERSGYRSLEWYETGCLCMLNPDYVKGEANWKQGLWVGMFSTKSNLFNVQLIPAVGRGFIYDGKHFGKTTVEQDIFIGPAPNFESDIPSDFAKTVGRTW
jgi:hypothetical protein